MTAALTNRHQNSGISSVARERVATDSGSRRGSSTASTDREVLPAGQPTVRRAGLAAAWLHDLLHRIVDLSRRTDGWDSYGGQRLCPEAVDAVFELLRQFGPAIQKQPQVSLTVDGGLSLEWSSAEADLDFTTSPSELPRVYYCEKVSGREWDGVASASPSLDKWLWRASSLV